MRLSRSLKVTLFFVLNLGVGLLQLWIMIGVYRMNDRPATATELLQDGNLFLYASILTVTSCVMLLTSKRRNGWAMLISVLILLLIVSWTCIAFAVEGTRMITTHQPSMTFTGNHVLCQIFLTIVSLVYAFYIAAETNAFKPE